VDSALGRLFACIEASVFCSWRNDEGVNRVTLWNGCSLALVLVVDRLDVLSGSVARFGGCDIVCNGSVWAFTWGHGIG